MLGPGIWNLEPAFHMPVRSRSSMTRCHMSQVTVPIIGNRNKALSASAIGAARVTEPVPNKVIRSIWYRALCAVYYRLTLYSLLTTVADRAPNLSGDLRKRKVPLG